MSLGGYTAPLSPDGRAGIVPPPPWHYSGDFLIAEYRTDPEAVAALLPDELEPAEDPGAVAAIFADWQSCSADFHELVDPIQSQYHEFFIVVGRTLQRRAGQPVRIYLGRQGLLHVPRVDPGVPEEARRRFTSRVSSPSVRRRRRSEPGARFGATCSANDRQIARMVVTLEQLSETGPRVNDPPMHNTRHFPAASGARSGGVRVGSRRRTRPGGHPDLGGECRAPLLRRHPRGSEGDRPAGDAAGVPVLVWLHRRRSRGRR